MRNAEKTRRKTIRVRKGLVIYFLVWCCGAAVAQSGKTGKILANSRQLVKAIFETKDSATLDALFAADMRHFTGNGKIETREEAIRNISGNRSVFVQADMQKGFGVVEDRDSTVVKYFFKGREQQPGKASSVYTVNLVMVWAKVKKEHKLRRLETIRIE